MYLNTPTMSLQEIKLSLWTPADQHRPLTSSYTIVSLIFLVIVTCQLLTALFISQYPIKYPRHVNIYIITYPYTEYSDQTAYMNCLINVIL